MKTLFIIYRFKTFIYNQINFRWWQQLVDCQLSQSFDRFNFSFFGFSGKGFHQTLAVMFFVVVPSSESNVTKITNVSWRLTQLVSIVGVPLQVSRTGKGFTAKQTKCSVVGFFHVDAVE